MKIKIKKLSENSVIPQYSKPGDAGLDLTCTERVYDVDNGVIKYKTGLSIAVPDGYVGLLFPRSSVYKYDMTLSNCVGVLDSQFRGEIMFVFRQTENRFSKIYQVGDRIGQLIVMPYPQIEFEEVDELDETIRGSGGFGSSGN